MDAFQSRAMHGDKSQNEHDCALCEFQNCLASLLITTDVTSHGPDIEHICMVVNFDFHLNDMESYIHRIGHTSCAGKKGDAISIFIITRMGAWHILWLIS